MKNTNTSTNNNSILTRSQRKIAALNAVSSLADYLDRQLNMERQNADDYNQASEAAHDSYLLEVYQRSAAEAAVEADTYAEILEMLYKAYNL